MYSGLKAGDTPSSLSGALRFSTQAEKASLPGRYTLAASGQSSSNYTISYLSGIVNVVSQGVQVRGALADVQGFTSPESLGAPSASGSISTLGLGTVSALASLVSTDDPNLLNELQATAAGPDGAPAAESPFFARRLNSRDCGAFSPAALLRCGRP